MGEANRLAKLMTGDCKNSNFNEIIKKQLISPNKGVKKPARKVALLSAKPKVDSSFTTVLKTGQPKVEESIAKPIETKAETKKYSRKQLLEIGQKLVHKIEQKQELENAKKLFVYEKAAE